MNEIASVLNTVTRLIPAVRDFSTLSARSNGAYPGVVAAALTEAASRGGSVAALARRLLTSASRPATRRPMADPRLPLPHPLDYDWRFTVATADWLLDLAYRFSPGLRTLLLVGTPTLALRAFDRGLASRIVYASRLDDPVTSALRDVIGDSATFVDVNDLLLAVRADVAIVDPPWYDELAVPLIARTALGSKTAAAVLVCGPDRQTQASAAQVLTRPIAHETQLGLTGITWLPWRPRYETPLFEINALVATGITNFHPQWRTGTVFVGRRSAGRLAPAEVPRDKSWVEKSTGLCRVRFRRTPVPGVQLAEPTLVLLPSVSRAHPLRECATIWTSGNRIGVACKRQPRMARVAESPFGGARLQADRPQTLRRITEEEQHEAEQSLSFRQGDAQGPALGRGHASAALQGILFMSP